MRAALDIHRDLLSRDVPHEVVRLPTGVLTADDLPRVLGLEPSSCVAVRCYVTDLGFVAVAVHAGALPEPGALLDVLGARTLRVATADEVNAATDYAAGLVSPLGLPPCVDLIIDAAPAGADVLYCPAGEAGVALGIRAPDLLEATGARVAPLTGLPLPRPPSDPVRGGDAGGVVERGRRPDLPRTLDLHRLVGGRRRRRPTG